jgi:hypothetical protein
LSVVGLNGMPANSQGLLPWRDAGFFEHIDDGIGHFLAMVTLPWV